MGKFTSDEETAEQLLVRGERLHDQSHWDTHHAMGNTLLWFGELGAARIHLEKGIALYQPEWSRSLAFHFGFNCASNSHFFLGRVLWHLGYPDHALTCAEQAVAIAAAVSHPVSRAGALSWAAALHQLRGEVRQTRELAETDLAVTTEEMLPFFRAHAMVLRGWALVGQGQCEEGIARLREGLVAYRVTGAELESSHWLGLIAEACRDTGQPEEGLRVIAEALDHVAQTGIVLRSRVASARWRTAAAPRSPGRATRGSKLPPSARNRRGTTREIVGAARRDEPRPAVGQTGAEDRSAGAARTRLWLVHRGLRHR